MMISKRDLNNPNLKEFFGEELGSWEPVKSYSMSEQQEEWSLKVSNYHFCYLEKKQRYIVWKYEFWHGRPQQWVQKYETEL